MPNLRKVPTLLWNHFTPPMREDVKQKGRHCQSDLWCQPWIYQSRLVQNWQRSSAARYAADFFDITSGNNTTSSIPGYSATQGWDAVTGLGTPNAANLAHDLVAASPRSLIELRGYPILVVFGASWVGFLSVAVSVGITDRSGSSSTLALTAASGLLYSRRSELSQPVALHLPSVLNLPSRLLGTDEIRAKRRVQRPVPDLTPPPTL
jgi:hypothetical protein